MTKPTNFKTWAYPAYNHYDMPLTLKRLEFLAMLYRMAKEGDIYPEIQDIKERCNLECGVYSINAKLSIGSNKNKRCERSCSSSLSRRGNSKENNTCYEKYDTC